MSNSNALWQIVLKETFLSADVWFLLIVPILAAVAAILIFKKSPLKSTNAWYNVGRRYLTIGCIFAGLTFVIYLFAILLAYSNKGRDNAVYTANLQTKFRDYYNTKKNYTQRLIDFAQRIENEKEILAEMDNFATNLPPREREKFGRTWSASLHAAHLIQAGKAFNEIEECLYWPEDKIAKYKKQNGGKSPGVAELRYTKEQIIEFKESNWAKLYPMLDHEQWIYIKNQILDIKSRDDILGFLRDIADCFQNPNPPESLNALYERLADKACPTELQKIKCYLNDSPKLFAFYKFSLQNRWWFRTVILAVIFIVTGLVIILVGRGIELDGKKKIFK